MNYLSNRLLNAFFIVLCSVSIAPFLVNESLASDSMPPSTYTEIYNSYTETLEDGTSQLIETFTPSGTIDGNVKLESGTLDLEGKVLQINGHLIHSGGNLEIENGTLIISGDYRMQTPADSAYTYADGCLKMKNKFGRVQVQGDFVIDTNQRCGSVALTGGILEIKGNFTQLSSHDSFDAIRNFQPFANHKVLLSGMGEQNVTFTDPSSSLGSHFENLEISNTSGLVNFGEDLSVNNLLFSLNVLKPTLNGIHINSSDFTLNQDLTIEVPEGATARISNSKLDLNGYHLTIKGDLMHSGGELLINGGALRVTGDYRIQTPNDSGYTYSLGYLQMVNVNDRVLVEGNFVTDSRVNHQNFLNKGVLDVKGDFMQLSSYPDSLHQSGNKYSFKTSGSHKVLLSGEGRQQVTFTDVLGTSYSRFTFLELSNTAGIDFDSSFAVSQLFDHCGYPFTQSNEIDSHFADFDSDGQKDHVDPNPKNANNQSNICSKPDRDGDGSPDDIDAFPDDWNESIDTDNDGVGDRADRDDDGDGVSDLEELKDATDSLNENEYHINTAPIIRLEKDLIVPLGEEVVIVGAGYDSDPRPDANVLSYPPGKVWRTWWLDNFMLSESQYLYFTPTAIGDHIIKLTLEDDDGATSSDLIVVSVPDDAGEDLSSGLVAHYEFEGNLRDSSGYNNHAISNSEIGFDSTVLGKAAVFSLGSETKIEIVDSTSLNTHDSFTLSLWVNLSESVSNANESVLIQKYNSALGTASGEYSLSMSKEGGVDFTIANYDAEPVHDSITSAPIVHGQWSHVVASFDNGEMRLYINGELDEYKISSIKKVTAKEYPNDELRIGNVVDISSSGGRFGGSLDDIRVYNRMLKVTEAKGIFEEGSNILTKKLITGVITNDAGDGIAGVNVKLEYLFDDQETNVTVVTDDQGNYDLTIDKNHFAEASPDITYLIYAYLEGYRPSTKTLIIGSENIYQLDFLINPIRNNEIVLEIEPRLHHLGDDAYSGGFNSQFQKITEGINFNRSFVVSDTLLNSYDGGVLTFEAKGIQGGGAVRINGVYFKLPYSPSDGSYATYTIPLDKNTYYSGINELILSSEESLPGDPDDFEFSNVILTIKERDTDLDGYADRIDTDDDNDGMPDTWELANGLDPLNANDARFDADGDNVINIDEHRAGTDPQSIDTDRDGINDSIDQVIGTGLWGYACNVVNDPSSSTRRWGINQYNLADLPNAVVEPVFSVGKNRKIQSIACDPSGKTILFSLKESVSGDYEIYELEVASGLITQITDNDTDDVDVTRSRDGRTIAWQKRLDDNRQAVELRRTNESGEYTYKTLASASPFVQPSLSPNGEWMTFVQLRPSFFAVMRYDIANNKYKEVKSIVRRKKLYHPSVSDDGNKVGWTERVSLRRYRVKDMTENTTVDILNDADGIQHAVLSGDGKHVIYSINTADITETYLTALETLDTQVVGETLNTPIRHLSSNWTGVTASTGFTNLLVNNTQLTSYSQGQSFHFDSDNTGIRYPVGTDKTIDFTWTIQSGILVITESSQVMWSMRLLAQSENQYSVLVIAPDEQGGIKRLIDMLYLE